MRQVGIYFEDDEEIKRAFNIALAQRGMTKKEVLGKAVRKFIAETKAMKP